MRKMFAVMILVLVTPLVLVTGCGTGSPAPLGSSILIKIDKVDWTVPGGTCTGAEWEYHPVYITVLGPNGRPVQNVDIYVSMELSVGTTDSAFDYNRIYDDQNWIKGNPGPPDPTTWVIAGSYPTNSGYTGTKMLIIATDLGCEHKGNFEVHSGTVYNSISIDVHI